MSLSVEDVQELHGVKCALNPLVLEATDLSARSSFQVPPYKLSFLGVRDNYPIQSYESETGINPRVQPPNRLHSSYRPFQTALPLSSSAAFIVRMPSFVITLSTA